MGGEQAQRILVREHCESRYMTTPMLKRRRAKVKRESRRLTPLQARSFQFLKLFFQASL